MKRRHFLKLGATAAASSTTLVSLGCGTDGGSASDPFPQGVGSGDPRPNSVVLWTRIGGSADTTTIVKHEVARDPEFTEIVDSGESSAVPERDHTVRVKIEGLDPYSFYYYRFAANGTSSEVGRTKTAPAPDADVKLRFAFASCQDFVGRYYHAWRAMAEEELDFVLFLGDYIYETDGDRRYQNPEAQPGGERTLIIPDGIELGDEENPFKAAISLEDYRGLYRQVRSDPDLRQAHQQFPFVTIWDDHEFANDAWQDHTNHFDGAMGAEQSTERRQYATRAWFEYQAVDAPHDPTLAFPEDARAYRSLRFGQHVELFVMDQRYYRSDHVIPEGPLDPLVGKLIENSSLGSRTLVSKDGFEQREAAALPTMLGSEQKEWLIDSTKSSAATWKLWASQTMMAQMLVDLRSREEVDPLFRSTFYFKADQWDGYRSERAEILTAVSDVEDLVVLTGDLHAFYAGELHIDFDLPAAAPVAVEYVVTGISSNPIQHQTQRTIESQSILQGLGFGVVASRFDEVLSESNPHLKHTDGQAYGYAVAEVHGSDELRVSFVRTGDPLDRSASGVVERIEFRTPAGSSRIERV